MSDDKPGFWTSLPGILTGGAAIITATTGLYLALQGNQKSIASDDPATAAVAHKPGQAIPAITQTSTETQRTPDIFTLVAVIEDPDGFTNVRSMKSSSSEIVTRIVQGERFRTYRQDGNWWQVQTSSGKLGYVHVSRIKIIGTN